MSDDPSSTLLLRQGVPTRLNLPGHRCRLGLATVARDEQVVTITVLLDGVDERVRVGVGDELGALQWRWRVGAIDTAEPGRALARLDPLGVVVP